MAATGIKEYFLAGFEACKTNKAKAAVIIAVIAGYSALGVSVVNAVKKDTISKLSYDQFIGLLAEDNLKAVDIKRDGATTITLKDGKKLTTNLPEHIQPLLDRMLERKVTINIDRSESYPLLSTLITALIAAGLALPGFVAAALSKEIAEDAKRILRARRQEDADEEKGTKRVTFSDVAGIDGAVEELSELVAYLKDPSEFEKHGASISKGALLVGPPGTGKTQLARAVAGEANVPFHAYSGADFFRHYANHGAEFVRQVFVKARQEAPCIIFIDEIDVIGKTRSQSASAGSASDDRDTTLNQLLTEIDGFVGSKGIIILAATNRPDVLDPAIIRPGRIDRRIEVPNPDVNGRKKILEIYVKKIPLHPDVDIEKLARSIPGFSGADVKNLVNEAALFSKRERAETVTEHHFEQAKDRVIMGAKRSMAMTEEERRLTAYHEAGHALLNLLIEGADPLHKVSIIPRGKALGVTISLPERDRYSMKQSELHAFLVTLFGGRCAEELVFGSTSVTTGASGDIIQATRIARSMVTEYGFSPLGSVDFLSRGKEGIFTLSEETTKLIDASIADLIKEATKEASSLLTTHRDALEKIANGLLEKETLGVSEVMALLPSDFPVKKIKVDLSLR